MKIIELRGGLGNQMFQIAFAFALSKEISDDVYLCNLCANEYNTNADAFLRPLAIDGYNVPVKF